MILVLAARHGCASIEATAHAARAQASAMPPIAPGRPGANTGPGAIPNHCLRRSSPSSTPQVCSASLTTALAMARQRCYQCRAASKLGLRCSTQPLTITSGLAQNSVSRENTRTRQAAGAASRLIHGTTDEHLLLETALATWVGAEAALLFSSTYSANVGLIAALGVEGSLVISDAFNHASLIDGARLAKAEVAIVPHLDLNAIRLLLRDWPGPCWVVTESYFSMDGDSPDLGALRSLCDSYGACLIVDEAHASRSLRTSQGAGRCSRARSAAGCACWRAWQSGRHTRRLRRGPGAAPSLSCGTGRGASFFPPRHLPRTRH